MTIHRGTLSRMGLVLAALILIWTEPVQGGDTVALILEAAGPIAPAVESHDQLVAGTSLRLKDGARLKVAHMASCAIITVAGPGKLSFDDTSYAWDGGRRVSARAGSCITRMSYVDPGLQPAGITLRAIAIPHLAPRPVFILEGYDAATRYEIVIQKLGDDGDEIVLELPQTVAGWPDDLVALERGGIYKLTLRRDGKASAQGTEFIVPRDPDDTDPAAPLLLRFR